MYIYPGALPSFSSYPPLVPSSPLLSPLPFPLPRFPSFHSPSPHLHLLLHSFPYPRLLRPRCFQARRRDSRYLGAVVDEHGVA